MVNVLIARAQAAKGIKMPEKTCTKLINDEKVEDLKSFLEEKYGDKIAEIVLGYRKSFI